MSHLLQGEIETDAAVTSSRELIASDIPRKVHQILAREGVTIFPDTHDPPDETVVQQNLIRPLEALWGANEVYRVLQSNPTVANFCGKVFKNGEPAIFCKLVTTQKSLSVKHNALDAYILFYMHTELIIIICRSHT